MVGKYRCVIIDKNAERTEDDKMYDLVNKYAFRSDQIKDSLLVVKQRFDNFSLEVNSDCEKEEFIKLVKDYNKLANSVISPKSEEYNSDYFQCCLDAMTEINFRMYELEKRYMKSRIQKKRNKQLFNRTRDDISTFTGMKSTILMVMILIIISITILKIIRYLFNMVMTCYGVKDGMLDIFQAIFTCAICLIPAAIIYKALTPSLRGVLLKGRVQREIQREMLIQILTIFITIFIAVLL